MRSLAERLAGVRERIAAAESRAGRPEGTTTLIAIGKTHPPERLRDAVAAGAEVLGENKVQEALSKAPAVPGAVWHLVGHLQRNKARRAVELFSLIHTLDSVRLAETLDRLGAERGRPVEALVQVNLSGEGTKSGVTPDDLPRLLDACAGREGLLVTGLMTIPAPADDPERSRPDFARLREMCDNEARRSRPGVEPHHLSMGMTHDFEVAVEEGATLVRIGTAIFGPRE